MLPPKSLDALYAAAAGELEAGTYDKDLWARALAESDGDERKQRVIYLSERVKQLGDKLTPPAMHPDSSAPSPETSVSDPPQEVRTASDEAAGEMSAAQSADQGDAKAQYELGLSCYHGQGVARDYAEAAKWYRKAADQDYAEAQHMLGLMYASGRGVAKDNVESYKWLSLAASRFPLSVVNRDDIASKMTPAQIAQAQNLAQEWAASNSHEAALALPTEQSLEAVPSESTAIQDVDAPFREFGNESPVGEIPNTKGAVLSGIRRRVATFVAVLVVASALIALNLLSSHPTTRVRTIPTSEPSTGENLPSQDPSAAANDTTEDNPPISSTEPPIASSDEDSSAASASSPATTMPPSTASPGLSKTQMQACAAESIRIKAAREAVDTRSKQQMRVIDSHLKDYRLRCESNGTPLVLSSDAMAFADAYRLTFQAEGRQWVAKPLRGALPSAGQSEARSTGARLSVGAASQEPGANPASSAIVPALPERGQGTALPIRNVVDAVLRGTVVDVRRMLDQGADVNDRSEGTMPLIVAVQMGKLEIAQLLIERGAELERADNNGFTAMKWAKQRGDGPMVNLLERAGAKNPYAQSLAR